LQNELKLSAQKGELTFIQDNEPNILINEYYLFYLRRCGMFSKSFHYFDEEPTVQKQFQNITRQEKGEIIKNYSFLPSCDNKFIQVSDMLVGMLSKVFSFLDEKTIEEISIIYSSLNEKQKNNFKLLQKLILKSNKHTYFDKKPAKTTIFSKIINL